ncbi:MAG: EAL domain-containing protein [Oscillospiraceae bacterium]|nr:EAL domain-containing protein [Oscillospiraceae bacterium]
MIDYIYEFEIAACGVYAILLVLYFLRPNYPSTTNKLYIALVIVDLAAAVLDLITVYTIRNPHEVPLWFNWAANMAYLWVFNGCAILFSVYIIYITKQNNIPKGDRVMCIILLAIDSLLIFTTPFTKLIFYFDENGTYTHGNGFIILYIISYSLLLYVLALFIIYRRKLNKYQVVAISAFNITMVMAIIIQFINKAILIQGFVSSLYLVIIYVSLQNPDDYMDKHTLCFNHSSFYETLEKHITRETPFSLVAFTIDDFRYINRILGSRTGNNLIDDIALYLQERFGARKVYHLIGCKFAIMLDGNGESEQSVISAIKDHFAEAITIDGSEILLTPCICAVHYPDFASTPEDITDSIDFTLNEISRSHSSDALTVSGTAMEIKHRETKVIHAIKNAIRNNSFMVYYQPIYDTANQCFNSAEALIRLSDEELGFIRPDEFIPLAEKNGMIVEIGEIVFRKVCRFISEHDTDKLGISYIEVNLSVIQCMQDNLAQRLEDIMTEYKVAPKKINFEITETSASDNDAALRRNMDRLIEVGSAFSMDDYGTGFSTANYLIHLPVSIVKIDKSILWPAMKDDNAMVILRHTVAMVKNLNKQIVVEGIEDINMANVLIEMGCDFLQGYYYSKPVAEKEYVEFLESMNVKA